MNIKKYRLLVFLISLTVLMSGCMGGDGSSYIEILSESSENRLPTTQPVQTTPTQNIEKSGTDSCEDIKDATLIDKCWLEQAKETMEVDFCEKMSNKLSDVYIQCLDNVARLTGAPDVCNKIPVSNRKESCLNIVCIIKGEPNREDCLNEQTTKTPKIPETTSTTLTASTTLVTPSTTSTTSTTMQPIVILELIDVEEVSNINGRLWVKGTVVNKGNTAANNVRVRIKLIGKTGGILKEMDSSKISEIAPGEQNPFNTIRTDFVSSAVERYDLSVFYD